MRARAAFLTVLIVSGCSKKTAIEPPVAAAPTPAAPVQPISEINVFERMAAEGANKNKSDPSTQKVLDALTKAGLTLSQQEQHLGATLGATHCIGVVAAEHLTFTVCEYASPAAATEGAENQRKIYAAIANCTLHVRRSTTMSVVEGPADQVAGDAHRKAAAVFEAL